MRAFAWHKRLVEFAGDDLAATVALERLGDPQSADAAERARFYDQIRLVVVTSVRKIRALSLPPSWSRTCSSVQDAGTRSGPVVFRLEHVAGLLHLPQDAVLLFFFF